MPTIRSEPRRWRPNGSCSVLLLLDSAPAIPYWQQAVDDLLRRGWRVLVASIGAAGPLLEICATYGASVFALGAERARDYPLVVVRLSRILRQNRVRVVHASGPIPTTLGGMATRLSRQGTTIYHLHHILAEDHPLFIRAAWRFADVVMPVSGAAAQAVVRNKPSRPIHVAWNGVPPPRSAAPAEVLRTRRELGIAQSSPVVVSIARLRPVKRLDRLIDAFAHLRGSAAAVAPHLVIIGDGPERPRLERLASATTGVHLVGEQDDVGLWLSMADVVAVTSHQESFGLVAAEAMALGRPVVANPVGGLVELLTRYGRAGLLSPADDARSFAESLSSVLNDAALAEQLGRVGRDVYEAELTTAAMVDRWLNVYRAALSNEGGGR